MFPSIKIKISGLDPNRDYSLILDLLPRDDFRYKFQAGHWTVAGKADCDSVNRHGLIHPDSPSKGSDWMSKSISFHKVKLTNNNTASDRESCQIVLNSMHKYVPHLYIVPIEMSTKIGMNEARMTFVFHETEFIAVTAYQNERITQLKIDHNPFAKGFRDNGSNRRSDKRAHSPRIDENQFKDLLQRRYASNLDSYHQTQSTSRLRPFNASPLINPTQQRHRSTLSSSENHSNPCSLSMQYHRANPSVTGQMANWIEKLNIEYRRQQQQLAPIYDRGGDKIVGPGGKRFHPDEATRPEHSRASSLYTSRDQHTIHHRYHQHDLHRQDVRHSSQCLPSFKQPAPWMLPDPTTMIPVPETTSNETRPQQPVLDETYHKLLASFMHIFGRQMASSTTWNSTEVNNSHGNNLSSEVLQGQRPLSFPPSSIQPDPMTRFIQLLLNGGAGVAANYNQSGPTASELSTLTGSHERAASGLADDLQQSSNIVDKDHGNIDQVSQSSSTSPDDSKAANFTISSLLDS